MTCPECGGEGFIITCCDDICHGLGYCIHGDGEMTCPECGGEGDFFDEEMDESLAEWAEYPGPLLADNVDFEG